MNSQVRTVSEQIFGDLLPEVFVLAMLIAAIIFLAKFLKKSDIKHGNLIFIATSLYLLKEFLLTLSAFLKGTFVVIIQQMVQSAQAASKSFEGLTNMYTTLTSYNVFFIISVIVTAVLFFVFLPKNEVANNEKNVELNEDVEA